MTLTWYAVRTKPGRETAALADIKALGQIDAYMPREKRIRRTHKGKETVTHPLIPGYLFVGEHVNGTSVYGVLSSRSVHDVVRGLNGMAYPIRPQVVDGSQRHFVYEMMARESAGEFDFTPRKKPLAKDGQARVLTGFYRDQIITLVSAPKEGRAEIMLTGLFAGRATIDVKNLEGVEEKRAA